MTPDQINALFEALSAILILINVKVLLRDKQVRGVSLIPSSFFTSWGIWNLYYYPSLNQWYSFVGGILLVSVNLTWLFLAFYYQRTNKRHNN